MFLLRGSMVVSEVFRGSSRGFLGCSGGSGDVSGRFQGCLGEGSGGSRECF